MAYEVRMPVVGLMMDQGLLGEWNVNEGDTVKKGDEVCSMETDKMSSPIEAPGDGILLKIVAPAGSELPPGALLGVIGEQGEDISAILAKKDEVPDAEGEKKEEAKTENALASVENIREEKDIVKGRVKISPLAKKIALQNEIDYKTLKGTGPQGRIVRKDVEAAIESRNSTAGPSMVRIAAAEDSYHPYKGMRKAVGENMLKSWGSVPKVTFSGSVDASTFLAVRRMVNEGAAKEEKISVTDMLVKAAARSLELQPGINASLEGDQILVHGNVNIGVAVAVERGLVVPVLKDANLKSLRQISTELKVLIDKARANKLTAEDMQGGTFTISNLGGYRSVDYFTPIINQPESAILGVGRTVDTPVAVNGNVEIRPMMGLSFAADHRVIDGAPAAEYLRCLMDIIENPMKYLL